VCSFRGRVLAFIIKIPKLKKYEYMKENNNR